MRDGIYRVEFRSGQTIGKGIAVADNDTIRGFDETYFYFVGHLAKYGRPKRRVLAMRYAPQAQGFSNPGFPATVYSEEREEEFLLKGEADGDSSIKITIHDTRIAELPWPSTTNPSQKCATFWPKRVRTFTSLPACEMCFGYRIWPARSKLTALNRPASTSFPVSSREVTRFDHPLRLCERT
jgi:hypothetical protein